MTSSNEGLRHNNFVIFHIFGQFFYHWLLSVWIVRCYASSDWTKSQTAIL